MDSEAIFQNFAYNFIGDSKIPVRVPPNFDKRVYDGYFNQ
jgi:hypothetical protein